MPDVCRFDDSLPRLLEILVPRLGTDRVEAGVVVRDVAGCLAFFSDVELDEATVAELSGLVGDQLGHYARPDRSIAGANASGTRRILEDKTALVVDVMVGESRLWIRYLDRRIVGVDWLRRPTARRAERASSDPAPAQRVVFCSLKGGVGRSTALSVAAAEQATRGRNVLVIDLDLEAPGIGSLLLSEDRMPRFGVIDYLVERNFWVEASRSEPDRDEMVRAMVGTCALTSGAGLVDVVPAIGTRTLEEPRNYLAKLSRAMIEGLTAADEPASLAHKLNDMLVELEAVRRYDFVFIDVRAGLAELTAGPLLTLDAEVLIFGTAQPQTLQDLGFLFAHLSTLTGDIQPSPWSKLKMVHAKAGLVEQVRRFRDELWDLFATYLYQETEGLDEFNFDADSPEAPHFPIVIPLDTAFADWDPVRIPENLVNTYYLRTFGDLISYIDDLLNFDEADAEE